MSLAAALVDPAGAGPATDYMLECRGCHGPDGNGVPGAAGTAPAFRGQLGRFLQVPGGREYVVRVPGVAQSGLDDARLAALLNWLLAEFSADQVPADFRPYDAQEVGRLRRPPLSDVETVRRRLVEAIK